MYDYNNIKAGEQESLSPLLYSIYNIYNGIRRGRPVAALSVIATARSWAQGGTEGGAVATAGGGPRSKGCHHELTVIYLSKLSTI